MAPPPRKRARYLSDDEDDEHIAADDALFARWRARIYPDLLKLLFRAGYKTEEALSSLEHTDLAAAAGFLGVRVKPGLVRSWDVFMRAKNGASTTVPTEPRAAAGASVSEVVRAAAIATAPWLEDVRPFFDPEQRHRKNGLHFLGETHTYLPFNWDTMRTQCKRRGSKLVTGCDFAGRTWNIVVMPHGEKINEDVFSLFVNMPLPTRNQTSEPEGYAINFVLDLRDANGSSIWDGEGHNLFRDVPRQYPRGDFHGFSFTKSEFDADLVRCGARGNMTLHLFLRLYSPGEVTRDWCGYRVRDG